MTPYGGLAHMANRRMEHCLMWQTDYGKPAMVNWHMANWSMVKDRSQILDKFLILK